MKKIYDIELLKDVVNQRNQMFSEVTTNLLQSFEHMLLYFESKISSGGVNVSWENIDISDDEIVFVGNVDYPIGYILDTDSGDIEITETNKNIFNRKFNLTLNLQDIGKIKKIKDCEKIIDDYLSGYDEPHMEQSMMTDFDLDELTDEQFDKFKSSMQMEGYKNVN